MSVHLAAVSSYELTPGRLWSVIATVAGLAGVVAAGLALAGRLGSKGALTALGLGIAGAAGGAVVVAAAKGGPGTGYGIVGGFLALVVGLLAVGLGGLALARARRGFVGGRR